MGRKAQSKVCVYCEKKIRKRDSWVNAEMILMGNPTVPSKQPIYRKIQVHDSCYGKIRRNLTAPDGSVTVNVGVPPERYDE